MRVEIGDVLLSSGTKEHPHLRLECTRFSNSTLHEWLVSAPKISFSVFVRTSPNGTFKKLQERKDFIKKYEQAGGLLFLSSMLKEYYVRTLAK